MINFDRGTVWWIDLPLDKTSHVQGGARPCVIVSNHLERSGVVTVCPMSTKLDTIKTHPRVIVKKEGQVLIEQITTVDISRIGDYAGMLTDEDIDKVDRTLASYLLSSDDSKTSSGGSRLSLKLFHIEKELKKISQMLEFMLWKDKKSV